MALRIILSRLHLDVRDDAGERTFNTRHVASRRISNATSAIREHVGDLAHARHSTQSTVDRIAALRWLRRRTHVHEMALCAIPRRLQSHLRHYADRRYWHPRHMIGTVLASFRIDYTAAASISPDPSAARRVLANAPHAGDRTRVAASRALAAAAGQVEDTGAGNTSTQGLTDRARLRRGIGLIPNCRAAERRTNAAGNSG